MFNNKNQKYCFIFHNCWSFFVYSTKKKNGQAIKYHRKKALFVGKKDKNLIFVQRCMFAQLSVNVMQHRIAKNGLIRKGGKSSGGQVV
ncbi:unnamed protein product, partial [Staurois parvus]